MLFRAGAGRNNADERKGNKDMYSNEQNIIHRYSYNFSKVAPEK